jgi:hypothetical protein
VPGNWYPYRVKNLFINDPFAGLKSVKVIAGGDLKNRIANIFLDLKYTDDANDYIQSRSVVLNAGAPFADWSFPVINESQGKLTYSGNAMLTDGTSRAIDLKTADSGVIIVPKPYAGFIDVLVVTDLVDFSACKLVRVTLSYQDDENLIHEQKDYIFSPAKKESQAWHIGICDQGKNQYSWEANFFMLDNSQRKTGSTASSDQAIVLEVPPAS